jgi:hypothetical protein
MNEMDYTQPPANAAEWGDLLREVQNRLDGAEVLLSCIAASGRADRSTLAGGGTVEAIEDARQWVAGISADLGTLREAVTRQLTGEQ